MEGPNVSNGPFRYYAFHIYILCIHSLLDNMPATACGLIVIQLIFNDKYLY